MTYLLDTNVFSDVMAERGAIQTHLSALAPSDDVVTSPIVRGEVLYGIMRLSPGRRRNQLMAQAEHFFKSIVCREMPADVADAYAHIKTSCESSGLSMADNDLWIAATAAAIGAVVVTRDTDFQKIPGLAIEDWTK